MGKVCLAIFFLSSVRRIHYCSCPFFFFAVQSGNTPTTAPPPPETPSPPPPSVTPSSPPPPFFPLPSPPPPPPVEKICNIDEGTYLIYGYDSGCGTRFLNVWKSNCRSRSVKAKKKTSRTATRFVVESKGNNRVSIRAVKCSTSNKYVAVNSRNSSKRNVYLSSFATSWRMISYDASSCSKVVIRAVVCAYIFPACFRGSVTSSHFLM